MIASHLGDFESITCGECGITLFVPVHWLKQRKDNGGGYTCPNGDQRIFSVSTADKLRTEKAELERSMQAKLSEETHLRLVAQKALRSEVTKRRKIEKRVANGVCPCCNRTFEDLARHMSTKHKDYALPPAEQKKIAGSVQ